MITSPPHLTVSKGWTGRRNGGGGGYFVFNQSTVHWKLTNHSTEWHNPDTVHWKLTNHSREWHIQGWNLYYDYTGPSVRHIPPRDLLTDWHTVPDSIWMELNTSNFTFLRTSHIHTHQLLRVKVMSTILRVWSGKLYLPVQCVTSLGGPTP